MAILLNLVKWMRLSVIAVLPHCLISSETDDAGDALGLSLHVCTPKQGCRHHQRLCCTSPALRTPSMCITSSSSSLTGTDGTLSKLSAFTWESRFSRSLKCSFHRHRMPSLSFIMVVPSFNLYVSVSVRRSFWWQHRILETCGCQHSPESQQIYLSTTCP